MNLRKLIRETLEEQLNQVYTIADTAKSSELQNLLSSQFELIAMMNLCNDREDFLRFLLLKVMIHHLKPQGLCLQRRRCSPQILKKREGQAAKGRLPPLHGVCWASSC